MHKSREGEEEQDLYSILRVTREAEHTDLRSSFRNLSQQYHPDKHLGEDEKASATDQFTKVKEAYEILSNQKYRRIYNEFGLRAARAASNPGMELVPYNDLVERFRSEFIGPNAGSGANAPRDAYFTVNNIIEPRVDATGLAVALEDGDILNTPNLAVFTRVDISTVATSYITQNDTIIARYSAACQASRYKGKSPSNIGEVSVSLRRQLDPYMQAEVTAHVPLEDGEVTTYGFKAYRSLSQNMTGVFDVSYDPERKNLTSALTYTRSFDTRCTASASWAFGSNPGYAFSWRRHAFDEYISEPNNDKDFETDLFGTDESETNSPPRNSISQRIATVIRKLQLLVEPMGLRWTGRYSVLDASLVMLVRRPIGENAPLFEKCEATGPGGPYVKARTSLGMVGWEVELGGGRRYCLADTAWGTSVAFGTLGVIWRLKVSRGGHQFSLPVVLHSSYADPKTATIAAVTTSVLISLTQLLIISPWQERKKHTEREEAKLRRADELEQGRAEAEAAMKMTKHAVERSRRDESQVEIDNVKGCGLLIDKAMFGSAAVVTKMKFIDESVYGREIELEAACVTDALQALVEKSTVQVVSATKSTLPGFWDPSAYGEKDELVLKVWYLFKAQKHECIIRDSEPLELPLSSHRVKEWN